MAALHCAALLMHSHIAQAQQEAGRHSLMLHMLCTNCDPLADWASSLAHACPWLRCHGLSLHQQRASKLLEPSMAPN